MKQQSFFSSKKIKKEHGGALSIGRRRARRPLTTKSPIHLTMRSELAHGQRSLLRHRPLIQYTIQKASKRFAIKVHEKAICGNHIHLLISGRRRMDLQNFFRVVAGHIAQGILKEFPLESTGTNNGLKQYQGGAPETQNEGGASLLKKSVPNPKKCPHPKNQRKFWKLLVYTRVVCWGRDFSNVNSYIIQNALEALCIIPYKPRNRQTHNNFRLNTS